MSSDGHPRGGGSIIRTFSILTVAVLALALTGPSIASSCTPTTSHADHDTGTLAEPFVGRYYVADDDFVFCILPTAGIQSLCSLWVYEESNGIDGLQRADEVHDDTCGGQIPGDTIVL